MYMLFLPRHLDILPNHDYGIQNVDKNVELFELPATRRSGLGK